MRDFHIRLKSRHFARARACWRRWESWKVCWWNATAFAYPAQYTFGTFGRNYLFGPGFDEFDCSLVKKYRFDEQRFVEFRAEVFNVFNHVNFNNPTNLSLTAPAAGSGSLNVTSQGSFGVITSAQPSRRIQLGMRFVF